MATASTTRKAPAPTVGKLKGPSKPVPAIKSTGKKTDKFKEGPESVAETAMAAAIASSNQLSAAVTVEPEDARASPIPSSSEPITSESLGSLVCISGTQVGVLRYFGETHFETGLWCGVECSEAVGKNDGSVLGVRYFKCKERFGIFAPLSKVSLLNSSKPPSHQQQNSGKTPKDCSASQHKPSSSSADVCTFSSSEVVKSKPKTLTTSLEGSSNNQTGRGEDETPVAPATTPVSVEDKSIANSVSGVKRNKKETKRAKDSPHRVNQQQKKKRKLDSSQKQSWSGPCSSPQSGKCIPTTTQPSSASVIMSSHSHNADLPNLLTVKLKEEILGASFRNSPLYSPPLSSGKVYEVPLSSSTPVAPGLPGQRGPVSRIERFRHEKYNNYSGTPKTSRLLGPRVGKPECVDFGDFDKDCGIPSSASGTSSVSEVEEICSSRPTELPTPLVQSLGESVDDTDADVLSPLSSPKGDCINLDAFPAKRPSSISLFPGFSSEDSSEQGIFGVSTPELIGGDGTSLALSIPTSCCSSPEELLDNESSLGLLTPSHLQDCWNSNTNDENLYLHLRSPSVDDVEEFEEEDKTVDHDLCEPRGTKLDNFRVMSSSLNGTFLLNQNDGLITVSHPMHQSLHEELHLSQGRVRRDRTYTQLPGVTNLNHSHLKGSAQLQDQLHSNPHPPLCFRESGSGSGSGYCASEPFTDSDFNTESEADHDHDECSSSTTTAGSTSKSSHVNATSIKNRGARVIDGALYTSHHHQHNQHQQQVEGRCSPALPHHPHSSNQHIHLRQEHPAGFKDIVGKGNNEMISSSVSVSVSSNSASACASEMESSGFYSDASERNPSGGSVMSESDGCTNHHPHRPSRHLSKSSSDCDDSSVATGMGMKMAPLKPLTLDAELNYANDSRQIEQILLESSLYDENNSSSIFETSLDMDDTGGTIKPEDDGDMGVAIIKTNPPIVEYQKECEKNCEGMAENDQQVPSSLGMEVEDENMDLCEDMGDVDMFAEFDNQSSYSEMETGGKGDNFGSDFKASQDKSEIVGNNGITPGLTLGNDASHEKEERMEFELEESFCYEDSKIVRASPPTSPIKTGIPVAATHQTNALHGNLFDSGIGGGGGYDSDSGFGLCLLGLGGGGGTACLRSQSVNCIASLTSSTSSASTVTTKSCVTSGGPSKTNTATHPGANVISTKHKLPSSDAIHSMAFTEKVDFPVPLSIKAKSGRGKVRNGCKQNEKKVVNETKGEKVTSCSDGSNVTSTTEPQSGSSRAKKAAGKGSSATSTRGAAAEQSSDVSTTMTSGNSGNTSTRSSRTSTANGKGTSARKGTPGSTGGARNSQANSSNISTISSSTDLNRTNRSTKSTVHGSTRSLASVGLAPSNANKSSSSVHNTSSSSIASVKKSNKWDAVMSKIAETKNKPINVKNVKSRVFISGKSGSEVSGSSSASTTGTGGKGLKALKSTAQISIEDQDRGNENDPLVPPAVHHRRQQHFSSRSSTVSDSSVDDQPQRGPPPAKHRVKKDAPINRRQVSDLSSASEYSATTQSQRSSRDPPSTTASLSGKTMTTGGTKRAQRAETGASGATTKNRNVGTRAQASTSNNTTTTSRASTGSTMSQGTKGAQTGVEPVRKKAVNSSLATTSRGGTTKSNKAGSSTVSSQNDPSTKSHPAVKPLRDRNRLGPVGKNYGSSGLDANANESEGSLNRSHRQSNGELGKTSTKVSLPGDGGVAEPLIDSANNTSTKKPANNRVSAANQQNLQNSLLVQENSSLKEKVSMLTSVVSDLQQQISQLVSSGEETRKTLQERLNQVDMSSVALAIIVQQCDKEKNRVYEQLVEQETENKDWKRRLDEKLAELQKLEEEYEKERELHQEEMRTLASNHEIEVDVTVRNCEHKLQQMQKRHDDTLAELKRSHTEELEQLQKAQQQELEQTIHKHRELLKQHRNQSPHDILHKEVESLQVVLDMKNEEIKALRKDSIDFKNTVNDLQMAREHGKSLLAKIEDLEAQLEKARSDKRSLQERYQSLEAALQQVEADNSRLVRANDELNWKMKSYDLVES